MASLTEESLSKLIKQESIAMMVKIQNKMESSDTKFAEEVRKLNESFQQLKSDLSITKNLNSQLHNRFVNMERQCWANAQYSRRECVEIVGITTSVPDNELEETFCKIADKVEVKIDDRDIEFFFLLCLIFMMLGCLPVLFGVFVYKSCVSLKFYFRV